MKDTRLATIKELNNAAVVLDKRTREIINSKYAEISAELRPIKAVMEENLRTSRRFRIGVKGFPWKISAIGSRVRFDSVDGDARIELFDDGSVTRDGMTFDDDIDFIKSYTEADVPIKLLDFMNDVIEKDLQAAISNHAFYATRYKRALAL